MNEYKKYLQLLKKLKERNKILSNDELKFIIKFEQDVDQGLLDKKLSGPEWDKLSESERGELQRAQAHEATKLFLQDPSYKQHIIDLNEEAAKGRLTEQITTGLNIALAGSDVVSAIGQTQQAKGAARRSLKPQRPAPLTESPELKYAIEQAQQGNMDAVRALAPAQLAILDNYLSDLNQAKTASTGQAGTYGALGQLASNRRNRANVELAPMYDSVVARNQGRLDNLLGMKLAENQAIQQSQAAFYPTDINQYQYDQTAANNNMVAGQQNLRGSLTELGKFLPKLVAESATKKRYDDIFNSMSSYPEFQDLAARTSVDNQIRHNQWDRPSWYEQVG